MPSALDILTGIAAMNIYQQHVPNLFQQQQQLQGPAFPIPGPSGPSQPAQGQQGPQGPSQGTQANQGAPTGSTGPSPEIVSQAAQLQALLTGGRGGQLPISREQDTPLRQFSGMPIAQQPGVSPLFDFANYRVPGGNLAAYGYQLQPNLLEQILGALRSLTGGTPAP